MKKNEPFRGLLYPTLKKILRIMRIAVILLLFGLLQTQANNAWSQKTKLSVNFSNTELVNVLDQIENDTEFLFLSNGPGDPERAEKAIQAVRHFAGEMPIFGICLGHQVIQRSRH